MTFTWNRDAALSTASTPAPTTGGSGQATGTVSGASTPASAEQSTVGDLLVGLLDYFTVNLPLFPALVPAAEALSPAIEAYRAGPSTDPYGPARRVVDLVTTAQQADPAIPSP